MGPFKVIGNVTEEKSWAHLRPLAVYIRGNGGPIWAHRQHVSRLILGPFKTIGSISQK